MNLLFRILKILVMTPLICARLIATSIIVLTLATIEEFKAAWNTLEN